MNRTDNYAEPFYCCPVCGGDAEKLYRSQYYTSNEVYGCDKCIDIVDTSELEQPNNEAESLMEMMRYE